MKIYGKIYIYILYSIIIVILAEKSEIKKKWGGKEKTVKIIKGVMVKKILQYIYKKRELEKVRHMERI